MALVCHGTCILLRTRLTNGEPPVKGKIRARHACSEEAFADRSGGMKIQPFWIEDEATALPATISR
ncbi:MAG: hypothetical protein KF887_05995 [Paracoccaceae bacterium]|nr:MAG: hypothetical protein KF887_05995 [Paracoccaceae bacterium]